MLVLRDVQSSKTHSIPPSGAVLGREGGDADITVRDKSVSKHHARVYALDGEWWLEDLNSANGTYVDDQRINGPVPLGPNVAFTLSNYQFEVVKVSATDGDARMGDRASPKTRVGGAPSVDEEGFAEPTSPPAAAARKSAPPPPRATPSTPGRPSPARSSAPPPPAARRGGAQPKMDVDLDEEFEAAQDEVEEVAAAGGNPLAELPRAIAYYLVTIPKVLFNPLGTIRASIEEQPLAAMKGMPLLGWGLPPMALLIGLGTICGIVASIINLGHTGFGGIVGVFTGAIVGLIIAAIAGIVGGLVIAFAYHPIFKFFVEKLFGGKTTEKSRTNYLPIAMSCAILAAIPGGLLAILMAIASYIPVPRLVAFVPVVPGLVGLAGILLVLYNAREWMKHFETKSWVPLVITILMVLAGLGTAWGSVVTPIRVAIAGGGGGTMVATGGMTMGASHGKFEASRMTPEQKKMYDQLPPQSKAAYESSLMTQWEAEDKQKAAMSGSTGAAATSKTAMATPAETKVAMASTPEMRSTPQTMATPASNGSTGSMAAMMAENNGSAATTASTGASSNTAYGRYAARREQVEKAIADDPTILTRDAQVLGLYKQLHALMADSRRRYTGKFAGPDETVTQHLVEADVYQRGGAKLVDDLHQRMFRN